LEASRGDLRVEKRSMSKRKRQSHRRAKAARSAGKSTAALDPQVNCDAAGIGGGAV
jgi:hypothetical protein